MHGCRDVLMHVCRDVLVRSQVDSVWKLGSHPRAVPAFDLVVIDESESVLRHFASPTVRSPVSVMRTLRSMVAAARHGVITMDAFWGSATHDFLRAAGVPPERNRLVINEHRGAARTFRFSNDRAAWTDRVLEDLAAGCNVVVVSLSTETLYKVAEAVSSRFRDAAALPVLMHTSKTGDEVKKELRDVDALWSRYRLVMYSPTIEAGVDFSLEHFDRMYLYVCGRSTTPLGAMQMTGRVRKLRTNVVDACAASSVRLLPPWPPAATTEDVRAFLTWVDQHAGGQEEEDEKEGAGMDDTTAVGSVSEVWEAAVVQRVRRLPVEDAVLPVLVDAADPAEPPETFYLPSVEMLVYAERDRINASRRFLLGFRELAEDAGHVVEVVSSVSDARAAVGDAVLPTDTATSMTSGESVAAGVKHQAGRLLAAPDLDAAAAAEVEARVMANTATEEDKWAWHRHIYKSAWGLGTVDAAFVEENGVHPCNPCTVQLCHVLFPERDIPHAGVDDLRHDDKAMLLRAPLIRQTLHALGFAHPFDTAHVVRDLEEVWVECMLHTHMFGPENYKHHVRLFSADAAVSRSPSDAWKRGDMVKAINMVLRRIGITLEHAGAPRQVGSRGARLRKYEYRLCPSDVAKAAELLSLRQPSCVEGGTPLAVAIRATCACGVYAHLARTPAGGGIATWQDDGDSGADPLDAVAAE